MPANPNMQVLRVFPAKGPLFSSINAGLVPQDGFTLADNAVYDNIGTPSKRDGLAKFNSSAVTNGTSIWAVSDFIRVGAADYTLGQQFMAIVLDDGGTPALDVWRFDSSGAATSVQANWNTDAAFRYHAHFTTALGYIVWSDGLGTARKWDQSSATDLGTSAPRFRASAEHLRRLFVGGLNGNFHRLQYSAAGDITDWTGVDAGQIEIGHQGDGPFVTGLSKSFRDDIYIFKGPKVGSVWRLRGKSPSTFTLEPVTSGIGAVNHKGVVTTESDVYWVSHRGIHSLSATQKYGDVEAAFLSAPIQNRFNAVKRDYLPLFVNGFYNPAENIVGWIMPSATTDVREVYVYNLLHQKWSVWTNTTTDFWVSCCVGFTPGATEIDRPRLYIGSTGGFILQGGQSTLSDVAVATSAIDCDIRTPVHTMGEPNSEKIVHRLILYIGSSSNDAIAVTHTVDGTAHNYTATPPGTITGSMVILPVPIDSLNGRGHQFRFRNNTAGEDLELLGYEIHYTWGERQSDAASE